MKNNNWRQLLAALCISLLTACGGGGGGGGAGTGGGTGTPAAGSEGTLTSPVPMSAGLLHSGTVSANGPSYYLFSGLSAGAAYSVTFGNVTGSIIPFLYSSDTQANGQSCFYSSVSTTASCIVQASSTGNVFIQTGNYSLSGSSSYTIDMALAAEPGQGAPTAPVTLAGLASHTGALTSGVSTTIYDPGNSGYYALTGLTAGHRYSIALTASAGNAVLKAYQSSYALQACSTSVAGGSAYCYVTAKGTSLLLQVSAKDAVSFTLGTSDLGAVAPFATDGSPGSEMALTVDAAYGTYNGSVNDSKSYYTVGNLVPGQKYRASLSLLGADIDLYAYADPAYTQLACSSTKTGTTEELCAATPNASGRLWLVADGAKAQATLGSQYIVGLKRISPTLGTSAQPQVVNSATELPYRVSAGNGTFSYYKVTGLAPNTPVLLTFAVDRGNSPAMSVYSSTYTSGSLNCSGGDVYVNCNGTPNAAGELYVSLSYGLGVTTGGTGYLDIKPLPVAEGTATAPLAKDMGALGNQFAGQVDAGASYYALTGLTPSASYYILSNSGADGDPAALYVFTTFTGDLSTQTADCSISWSYLNNGCTATADASGKLWVKLRGWTTTVGTHYKIEALPAPVFQGTPAAPLNITGALPYRASIGSDGNNHYMVTGLTPGAEYLYSKNDSSMGGYLYVYDDSAMTTLLCSPEIVNGPRSDTCRGKPTGSTVYIKIWNAGYLTAPGYFTLDIAPVPAAEGSPATPVAISATGTRAGSVNVGVSHYKATLSPNTSYTVSLSSVTGDADLHVYNNAAMSSAACSSLNGKNRAESCQVTSDASGNLWIAVDGQLGKSGASYQLTIN